MKHNTYRLQAIALLVAALTVTCTTTTPAQRSTRIAEALIQAIDEVRPLTPPTQTHGPLSIEEAYQVQDVYAAKRADQMGYKVAFATAAAQRQWGLQEPIVGPLFRSQQLPHGAVITASAFNQFRYEVEIAYVIGRPIDRAIESDEHLRAAVTTVHLALDLPDQRFDQKPTAADIIATGAGAHRFVLGPPHHPSTFDLDALQLSATKNGAPIYRGASNAVMNGQWHCLKWAVNHLVGRGKTIPAGTIILTGAVDKPFAAPSATAASGRYIATGGEIGTVIVNVTPN